MAPPPEPGRRGKAPSRVSACRLGFVSAASLQCGGLLLGGGGSLLEAGRASLGGEAFAACPGGGGGGSSGSTALPRCEGLAPRFAGDRQRFAERGILFTSWPEPTFDRRLVLELDAYLAPGYSRQPLPRWGRIKGSPNRVSFGHYQRLAPSDETVQGPHQENMPGDPDRSRTRLLAFICEDPAERGGATAFFDMQAAWEQLPSDLKALLRGSSFEFPMMRGDWQKSPCVLENEFSGAPALQFYGFGGVARECVAQYRELTGRTDVVLDPYTYGAHPTRGVLLVNNTDDERIPFEGDMLRRTVAVIYRSMVVHEWTKGDVLLLDNVRWAHARLEGNGPGRKINFAIYSRA